VPLARGSDQVTALPKPARWTPEEYLAMEDAANERHELIRGSVVAMAGASIRHNLIFWNLGFQLESALRGGPCRTMGPDQRVEVDEATGYLYPDLLVVCGEPKLGERDRIAITNPTMVVEILSPSTEIRDRNEKFRCYESMPGPREIVLISQETARVESYVRDGPDRWVLRTWRTLGDVAEFPSIGVSVSLREIYRGISWDAEPASDTT
jgi:Uma2 family endonuclease